MSEMKSNGSQFEHKHVVGWYTIFVCCFVAFGSMTYAATAAVISTTLCQPSFYRHMGLDKGGRYYAQANTLIGLTNSLFYAGGIFRPFIHGWVADAYGRKASIFVGCLICLISQALITSSADIAMFIAFRFFAGMGAFQCASAVPMYISEIVPPRDRGKLGDIHAFGINTSYTITGYTGLGFFFFDSPNAFRGPLALTMIAPLTICLRIWWMPESPRYLLTKDRQVEAWEVINGLHSDKKDPRNEFAKREYYQMQKQIQLDVTLQKGYKEILSRPSYRKRALITITITLFFCVMSSGILVIQNYGVIIFARLGYNNLQQLYFQTGYTANALFWSIIAILFVDLVPRNRLLGTGFGLSGVCLTVYIILLNQFEDSTNRSALAACVAKLNAALSTRAGQKMH